jgi:cytochrome c556
MRLTALAAALVLLAMPAQAGEPALDQDAIAYRKHVMVTLEAQFKAIAHIVAFEGPPENLMSHLQTALITARQVLPSFEKPAPGGTSQPVIWDKWSDYTLHMRQFEAAIAMAIEAAKFGNVTDVVWYTDQISCRKCHDTYRQAPVRGGEEYLGY